MPQFTDDNVQSIRSNYLPMPSVGTGGEKEEEISLSFQKQKLLGPFL